MTSLCESSAWCVCRSSRAVRSLSGFSGFSPVVSCWGCLVGVVVVIVIICDLSAHAFLCVCIIPHDASSVASRGNCYTFFSSHLPITHRGACYFDSYPYTHTHTHTNLHTYIQVAKLHSVLQRDERQRQFTNREPENYQAHGIRTADTQLAAGGQRSAV